MRIKISHFTEYSYSSDIFLEPHYLRFKPKITPYNNLESFNITVSPDPAGITELFDADSNLIHFCWFEEMNRRLTVKADSVINLTNFNPLNFILYPDDFNDLPFHYSDKMLGLLGPSLSFDPLEKANISYGELIKEESENKTVDFLLNFTKKMNSDFVLESRKTGQPHNPDITFNMKKGSCRDLAWFQIQVLRYMGIASRFVSGYFFIQAEKPEFELHAWLEAYLPGAGWIGLDPSHGIVTGMSHIPIACSPFYEKTMPVSGTVRGGASSDLITRIDMEIME